MVLYKTKYFSFLENDTQNFAQQSLSFLTYCIVWKDTDVCVLQLSCNNETYNPITVSELVQLVRHVLKSVLLPYQTDRSNP